MEKIYKGNQLAAGSFVALGRTIDLATATTSMFLLAARDDELTLLPGSYSLPPRWFARTRAISGKRRRPAAT